MKKTFAIIAILLSSVIQAQQVTKVSIQASGLTCSMCSNAINKSLRSLDFVDKVDANIKIQLLIFRLNLIVQLILIS